MFFATGIPTTYDSERGIVSSTLLLFMVVPWELRSNKMKKDMTQELTNAVENYVNLLPYLYASPNDNDRLLIVAYQLVMNEERMDEEFDDLFVEILTRKFKDYSQDAIISFYHDRRKELCDFKYVIDKLQIMGLIK